MKKDEGRMKVNRLWDLRYWFLFVLMWGFTMYGGYFAASGLVWWQRVLGVASMVIGLEMYSWLRNYSRWSYDG